MRHDSARLRGLQSNHLQGQLGDVHHHARRRRRDLRSCSRRAAVSIRHVAALTCATLLGPWLTPPSAAASGNAIARFGAEHGTVNATNPTALYYNPGALGFTEGTQLFVDGQLALRSLSWTHAMGTGDSPEPPLYEGANYGKASALNVFGGPMAGVTMRLGDFALGAAAYAPFGGQVSFDKNQRFSTSQHPGAVDGVARWHAIEASTMSIYTTLGAAYRVGPVSLGVTGNLIFSTISMYRAQATTEGNPLEAEGRSRLDASGVHGSFGAGVMVEALPQLLWLSASYQAQPGFGEMKLKGDFELETTVPATPDGMIKQAATFRQALPDIWRIGARLRVSDSVELRLAGDYTRWSVNRTQCLSLRDQACQVTPNGEAANETTIQNLRRFWKDTVGVRVGGSYWTSPALELFAGLGYETAAAPDSTIDPVLADANNFAAAVGARYEVVPSWFLAASYTNLQFFTRDNTGKSDLADPDVGSGTRRPDGGGIYKQWVGVLNANVLKTF